MENILLDSISAIEYLLNDLEFGTYYAISKEFKKKGHTVTPIQLSTYHKGLHQISERTAIKFKVFGIEIADSYRAKGRPSW